MSCPGIERIRGRRLGFRERTPAQGGGRHDRRRAAVRAALDRDAGLHESRLSGPPRNGTARLRAHLGARTPAALSAVRVRAHLRVRRSASGTDRDLELRGGLPGYLAAAVRRAGSVHQAVAGPPTAAAGLYRSGARSNVCNAGTGVRGGAVARDVAGGLLPLLDTDAGAVGD